MNQVIPIAVALSLAAFNSFAASAGWLVRLDRHTHQKIQCPLKHTNVKAEISGTMARVKVMRQF